MSDSAGGELTDDVLGWVVQRLSAAAAEAGLTISHRPELSSPVFQGGGESDATRLAASDLPSDARAMSIGRFTVIAGVLPAQPTPEAVSDALRRYRNQCVVARSYLTAHQSLDLQLWLIGPRGSERVENWTPYALEIERDERVARKLVWLMPSHPAADEVSFGEFAKRTFLARPWVNKAVFTMAALDNLIRLPALDENAVPRTLASEWMQIAVRQADDPDELVDRLVETWSLRSHP